MRSISQVIHALSVKLGELLKWSNSTPRVEKVHVQVYTPSGSQLILIFFTMGNGYKELRTIGTLGYSGRAYIHSQDGVETSLKLMGTIIQS